MAQERPLLLPLFRISSSPMVATGVLVHFAVLAPLMNHYAFSARGVRWA
jgi:hypothetical protein